MQPTSSLRDPPAVTVHTETIRAGEVMDAEACVRWLKRPETRPMGWHNAVLEINGAAYDAECFFTADDETGHVWQVIDLHKPDGGHYRLTIGPDGTLCDCPHATFREVACTHAAGVLETLDRLEALERAEWEAAMAGAALDIAGGPKSRSDGGDEPGRREINSKRVHFSAGAPFHAAAVVTGPWPHARVRCALTDDGQPANPCATPRGREGAVAASTRWARRGCRVIQGDRGGGGRRAGGLLAAGTAAR